MEGACEIERLRDSNTQLRAELLAARVGDAERQAAIDADLERLRGIARASGRQT